MKARRAVYVAAVVVLALLVASAPVASITATNVVSIHTTDTDFNAGSLTDMSVSGSGESATVEHSYTSDVDSFETQAADSGVPDGWSVDSAATATNVTTVKAYQGTQSWGMDGISGPGTYTTTNSFSSTTQNASFATYIQRDDGFETSGLYLREGTGTSATKIKVEFRDGDLTYLSPSSGYVTITSTPTIGEWIFVEVYDIDPATDTFSVYWETPGDSGTATGLDMAEPMSSGYDRLRWSAGNAIAFADVFTPVPSTGTTSGQYISSNHSVSNAKSGFVNLTRTNENVTVEWQGWDGSQWVVDDTTSYTTDGNKSVSLSPTYEKWRVNVSTNTIDTTSASTSTIYDEGVSATVHSPRFDNSSASPSGSATETGDDVTLSIDVNDTDFSSTQGDSVDVEFFVKGPEGSFSSEGTDTLTSNGTASLSIPANVGGTYQWYATADDSYGLSNTSDTFTFKRPGNLTIREETEPHNTINSVEVSLIFYEDEDESPTIVNRTTANGNVNLGGLPVGDEFSVSVSADGYHNRTVLIEDFFNNQNVFLLSQSEPSVENRFFIDDRTGEFPGESSDLIVQKAVNQSLYGGGTQINWTAIAGDNLGAGAGVVVDLKQDDRYRIKIQNDDGDERVLGAYVASSTGTVTLVVGRVILDPTDDDSPSYGVNRTNETGAPVRVNLEYNDSTENTDQLYVTIYEYNNESNVLLSNTSFSGPYGTFALTQDVPSDENETTWLVKFTAIKSDGTQIQASRIVGPTETVFPELPEWLVTIFFVGTMLTVAGLFSKINGAIGGIVLAALGGMLWFIGLAPPTLGVGVVVLALVIGAAIFLNEFRGTGL